MGNRFFTWIILFFSFTLPAVAQQAMDTSDVWRIETHDDNTYFGNILKREAGVLILDTENLGTITIRLIDVKSIERIKPQRIVRGEYWPYNPQSTRYFISSNAYPLKRGEGFYQNFWVLFSHARIGITDHFSLGLGTIPAFLFGGLETPIWLTPKVSIPISENAVGLGAGALIATAIGSDPFIVGIAYGNATFGSPDKNLTIGLGYGFAEGEWSRSPTINVGGMLRLGKKGYLMMDNYLLGLGEDTVGLFTLGGRVVWPRISLDYGLVIPIGEGIESFFTFPVLGVGIPFGNG